MIKIFSKVGTEGNFLNMIKGIYEKSTGNVIINGERLKAFLPRKGILVPKISNKTRMPIFTIVIQHYAGSLARASRQEKK